jgi:peptide-methionine (S)-S-oxide reductase
MVGAGSALPGRDTPVEVSAIHFVNGNPLEGPWPDGMESVIFGMGCFWGAERLFWEIEGVHSTSVGYAGGFTPNASYREVCSGATGHIEAVLVAYSPSIVSFAQLLQIFWEGHDPTQGMRQGNDSGSQYRSAIYAKSDKHLSKALASAKMYEKELARAGYGAITTEILQQSEYFYAEDYHQQYLAKSPGGYCGIGGTGVSCPTGLMT